MSFLPYVLFARCSDFGSVSIGFLVTSPGFVSFVGSGMEPPFGFLKNFYFGSASGFFLASPLGFSNVVDFDLGLLFDSHAVY